MQSLNRSALYIVIGAAATGVAVVQGPSVLLQGSSPGAPQVGHLNVTGFARAGVVVGYGPGNAVGGYFTSDNSGGAGVQGQGTSATGVNFGGKFSSASNAGRGVYGGATSLTGSTYGGFFESASANGTGVRGTANATSGVNRGGSFLAAGTSGKGVEGWAESSTGSTYGVYGHAESDTGTGVYGEGVSGSGYTQGVYGYVESTSGRGVRGHAAASSGSAYGGYFTSNSSGGYGIYATGVLGAAYFRSTASGYAAQAYTSAAGATGVLGSNTSSTGTSRGVYGSVLSPDGKGIHGYAGSNSGVAYGGYFESRSGAGHGVYALASASSGGLMYGLKGESKGGGAGVYGYASNLSGNADGVKGEAKAGQTFGVYGINASTAATSYGVFGEANSGIGWGLWAQGRSGASGTKSFRIDHPLDPESKFLLHYCAEGAEPMLEYSGNITTDSKGFADVTLPDYFDEITRDPRLQLTVEDSSDDFVMVKAVGAVKDGRFRIRTSKPMVKVYWEVKAVRNDRWVQRYGAPKEQVKDDHERNRYTHPELYNRPASRGIFYRETEQSPEKPRPR